MTWNVIAASVTGEAHLKHGKGNEDAFCLASRLDGSLVLAVADGAGSASCGAEGAELATTFALEFLSGVELPISLPRGAKINVSTRGFIPLQTWAKDVSVSLENTSATENDWQALMLKTVQYVHNALEAHAVMQEKEARDFACTLLVAVLTPSYIAALQIGDGAIVGMNGETITRLTRAAHGEYASETVFVTSQDYLGSCSCVVVPSENLTGLAFLTDGLEPVAMNLQTGEPFAPFFTPLFRFVANEKEPYEKSQALALFLSSERINQRTHDDKTLVLVVGS